MYDLTGRQFGKLTVIRLAGRKNSFRAWECTCECGAHITTTSANLVNGRSKSCGCTRREKAGAVNRTHGATGTPEWQVWKGMLARCLDPSSSHYKSYGARGITVCDEWKDLKNFLRDMGPRPSKAYTLDRKDNDGSYCKSNCRWATRLEQANNKRTSRFVEAFGKRHTIAEWSRITGIRYPVIIGRLNKGIPAEDILGSHR